ncbi:hypothetical protein [Baaleninema simplex]|uniref:hypothetical protein n=1 Tax=Baaleninema simplex TaxID=2862350 RepID=UPI00118181F4|nr:hypothetical protein [Baaleninema simplex]
MGETEWNPTASGWGIGKMPIKISSKIKKFDILLKLLLIFVSCFEFGNFQAILDIKNGSSEFVVKNV